MLKKMAALLPPNSYILVVNGNFFSYGFELQLNNAQSIEVSLLLITKFFGSVYVLSTLKVVLLGTVLSRWRCE